jgi:uncharacterized protein YcbK (DUF882 family)
LVVFPVALGVTALAGRVANVTAAPKKRAARPIGYADMVRRWHEPLHDTPEPTPEGRPQLVLEIINTSERVELSPLRDDGGFSETDLDRANYALRDPHTEKNCAMEGRVLDLAYRLQVRFTSSAVRIVSAFRSRSRSKHGKGRALDLVVPGAADSDVARYAETLGFVGVGLYPVSGFVHVDSRPRSYFWIDRSGPGQRTRLTAILPNVAAASDKRALARGEAPPEEPETEEEQSSTDGQDTP